MRHPTQTEVFEIVSLVANKPLGSITSKSLLRSDLGIDSLGAMDIKFEIEERFNIIIPPEAYVEFLCVQDILTYLNC